MNWTPDLDNELRRLHAEGMIFEDMVPLFPGSTRGAICGRAFRLGLKRGQRKLSPEERAASIKAKRDRWSEKRRAKRLAAGPSIKSPRVHFIRAKREPRPVNDLSDVARHLSFDDLGRHHCRFPYGDGPFTFCGHRKAPGSSYCAPHVLYCTGEGTASERSADRLSAKVRMAA